MHHVPLFAAGLALAAVMKDEDGLLVLSAEMFSTSFEKSKRMFWVIQHLLSASLATE